MLPDVSVFLSQRIPQDPLENFLGCQRQWGGTHNNPSVQVFKNFKRTRRLFGSPTLGQGRVKGNCKASRSLTKCWKRKSTDYQNVHHLKEGDNLILNCVYTMYW